MTPQTLRDARTAVLLGTRALVETERFDALVALLVAAGAVPAERAQTMLTTLSTTLTRHARDGHPEWQCAGGELRAEAKRLEGLARGMSS